jgi:hypothetical protein
LLSLYAHPGASTQDANEHIAAIRKVHGPSLWKAGWTPALFDEVVKEVLPQVLRTDQGLSEAAVAEVVGALLPLRAVTAA